jgi:environmental stress-induced protein Ves
MKPKLGTNRNTLMHILRAADRVATAWKNGGGITREIAAYPPAATLDQFGWRISIAAVSKGGAFSVFPGIERELVVLQGTLRLIVNGAAEKILDERSPPERFPGEAATRGDPVGGLVTDLNVMTRRGEFKASIRRLMVTGSHSLEHSVGSLFAIALSPMILMTTGAQHWLKTHDAVSVEPQDRNISLRAHNAACVLVNILEDKR